MIQVSGRKAAFIRVVAGPVMAGVVLSLGACGSSDESVAPKSMEEVKQEAAKLERPRSGQYKQTVEVQELEVPGMPKEAADQMKAMMQKAQVREFCLTPEDAEKGYRDMFNDVGKQDEQCTYTRFNVDGGKLDAQMDCKAALGGTGVIKLNGSVSESGSDVTMTMNATGGQAPMGTMNMKMHMTTQRMGDCPS